MHLSLQEAQQNTGLDVSKNETLDDEPEDLKKVIVKNGSVVLLGLQAPPREFDGRRAWPHCAKTIGHVRDQGQCGSCWAQAVVGVFNDRLCIASKGEFTAELSTADMTACDRENNGCNGGNPANAVAWAIRKGVVTGGDYPDRGDGKTCYPYPIVDKDSKSHFDSQVSTPRCYSRCQEKNYPRAYKDDKYKPAGHAYKVGQQKPADGNKRQEWMKIKTEISTKGSVVLMYAATQDHMSYTGGVWDCGYGNPNHAVKCIGYGVDPRAGNYITCVNSWNVHFGEKGLFRMKYPGNGCVYQMEGFPVSWAGQPEAPQLCPCSKGMPKPCCGDGKCQSGKKGPENKANCPSDCKKASLSIIDEQMAKGGRRRRRSQRRRQQTTATTTTPGTVSKEEFEDLKKDVEELKTESSNQKAGLKKISDDLKELKKTPKKKGDGSTSNGDNNNEDDNNNDDDDDNNEDDNNNDNDNDSDNDDDDDSKGGYCGRPWPTTTTTTTTTKDPYYYPPGGHGGGGGGGGGGGDDNDDNDDSKGGYCG